MPNDNDQLSPEKEALLKEIATLLHKHKITDVVVIYGLDGLIHNSYIHPVDRDEEPLYVAVSDLVDHFLSHMLAKQQ